MGDATPSPGPPRAPPAPRRSFVTAGGGLVTGAQAWSWVTYNGGDPKRVTSDFRVNALIAPSGIVVGTAYTGDGTFAIAAEPPAPEHNAVTALATLTRSRTVAVPEEVQAVAKTAVGLAADTLPSSGYLSFWTALAALAKSVVLSMTGSLDATQARSYVAVRPCRRGFGGPRFALVPLQLLGMADPVLH